MMPVAFRDRTQAGQMLARRLAGLVGRADLLVLALPRGGVPVAFEVAQALKAPLDVFVVRKLGVPGHEELAMGAVASGGTYVLNQELIGALDIPRHEIEAVATRELRVVARQERTFRGDRGPPEVRGRTVLLVDDGIATGATMKVAIAALKRQSPARLIVAVPVAAPSSCTELAAEADECVCVITPESFHAVGSWYQDFSQTTDDTVRDLLDRAALETRAAS
jgi:predicted phosphoribosyltransferase